MKKYGIYFIVAIVVIIMGILITATSYRQKRVRRLDERITLRQADKIPYGTSVAKSLLPYLFPDATIYYNKAYPSYWDSISPYESNQAVVLISDHFNADEEELGRLLSFVREGNYVFIVAKVFSYDAVSFFHLSYNETSLSELMNESNDSLRIRLEKPFFASDQFFVYPGRKYESSFYTIDTSRTRVLGRTEEGRPNFVQLNAGKGSIFIHIAPLAFSNYFILHKNNVRYYQNSFSVIPSNVNKLLWNEYYLTKPRGKGKEPSWLGVLMKYPSFKWGLITGVVTLFLYVLFNMRRRQRMIPVYERPKNDSLDFVKTLGRLYYERRDHNNLARKMGVYFLDHVRTRYKVSTQMLNEDFVQQLHYKTGYSADELKQISDFINSLNEVRAVSERELSIFHKQLEMFYQNT